MGKWVALLIVGWFGLWAIECFGLKNVLSFVGWFWLSCYMCAVILCLIRPSFDMKHLIWMLIIYFCFSPLAIIIEVCSIGESK